MGEQDHALHEIADARARMSELADELARHARPEHVKEIAAEKMSEWKERAKEFASEKAVELKEHAKEAVKEKASDIKTHAKEAVMQRTMDVKERVDTPRGWSLLGAIIGASVGAVIMKKAFSVREERSFSAGGDDFRYRGEHYSTGVGSGAYAAPPAAGMSGDVSAMGGNVGTGVSTGVGMGSDMGTSSGGGLKEHASDMAQSVKDKAHDLRGRAMGAVDQVRDQAIHLRERIPSGSELKGRATHWFDQALESQPLMLALGSAALGVFASLILPVSSRERQLIEPAKRKAQESISQLGEQLGQKLQGEETGNGGSMQGQSGTAMQSSTAGNIAGSERLMGSERPSLIGSDADTLTAPAGSRIPPLAPLDDLTGKIH
jgi:hypothetical protein